MTATWQSRNGDYLLFVMNKSKWDALPPDIQKIFTEVACRNQGEAGSLWNQMDIEGVDLFKSQGGQIIPLSDAEAAKWIKAVEPVIADYKKNMVSKGYKEAEVDGWLKYIKETVSSTGRKSRKRKE